MKILYLIISIFSIFSVVNAQDLGNFINEALANNPKIKAFELKYKIAKEKVNEGKALPNTQIGAGYFVSKPETRTGAQRLKVYAKQMIPFFGTVTARKNYAISLVDVAYQNIAITKRKLIVAVSYSYYNLYILKKKEAIVDENITLLNNYEKLALAGIEVEKSSAVDVLRLQIRQNELKQLKHSFKQRFLAELTKFNNILNRDKSSQVVFVDNFTMPPNMYDLVNVEELEFNPELLKYDRLYKSIEQLELLNKKESAPMLGFGLDYVIVSKRPKMNFSDNGKDIIMPMVSVSIPIFNHKHKSKTTQNELRQQELLELKKDRLKTLETLLDKALKNRKIARMSYNTQTENLKKVKEIEDILAKKYETGSLDFKDILDNKELQLRFQMRQIDSIKEYYLQSTMINYLITYLKN